MNEIANNENEYVGYEYKELTVSRDLETLYVDHYPQFGWEFAGKGSAFNGINSVSLKFKRNRKIKNKAELTRLQRQFESSIDELQALQKSKTTTASIAAFSIGIIGTAFMAGSVFAFLANMLTLSILLAVPAFVGWIIPYFCYRTFFKKKSLKTNPFIEQKYDDIDSICLKANALN